jgi:hypothetical protein
MTKVSASRSVKDAVDMAQRMAERPCRRERSGKELPQDLSEAHREFATHTHGLTNNLPLNSLEAMRAGNVASPHCLTRRYLMAARRIGLPKVWAQRYATWVQAQVDCLWPQEQTPTEVLAIRAMECEAKDDLAEKRLDIQHTRANLTARIDALQSEIAADQLLLGRLDREVEQAQ